MNRFKILGTLWIALGGLGLAYSVVGCALAAERLRRGASNSMVILFCFSLVVVLAGAGLLRRRVWARALSGLVSALLALYCVAYLVFAAGKFEGQGAIAVAVLLVFSGSELWAAISREGRRSYRAYVAEASDG